MTSVTRPRPPCKRKRAWAFAVEPPRIRTPEYRGELGGGGGEKCSDKKFAALVENVLIRTDPLMVKAKICSDETQKIEKSPRIPGAEKRVVDGV